MSDETRYARRTVLRASAAAAVASGGLLAGCAGGDGNSEGGGNGGSGGDGTAAPEDGGDNSGDGDGGDEEWRSFMEDANNFDGEAADLTGEDAVTVQVGAAQGFAFDPAAIRVSTGTTVTWEWTGEGGQHNVVAEDGAFESELTDEEGATFEQAFEEAAAHQYVCEPHQGAGMLGVVVVE